jgi:predicted transcriptional regulator
LSEPVLEEIKLWARITAKLRTSAEIDYTTGELTNFMYPEAPTRILEQLVTLYRALKSLDASYTDDVALDCLKKVVLSSCPDLRTAILKIMVTGGQYTQREMADLLRVNKKTAYKEMNILCFLGLAQKDNKNLDMYSEYGHYIFYIDPENDMAKRLRQHWTSAAVRDINLASIGE